MNTAASPDRPTPASETQHMCRLAMAELLKMTIRVAGVAARLVELEERALEVLAEGAEAAARGLLAAPDSMEAAIEAGRVADASDAARDLITARMAVSMETFKKATRSARLTALLAQRIEQPLRVERVSALRGETRARTPGLPEQEEQEEQEEREPSERLEDSEVEDDIGNRPTEEIMRDVCRDLGIVTGAIDSATVEPSGEPDAATPVRAPMPTAVQAYLARRQRRIDGFPFSAAPVGRREPDTG